MTETINGAAGTGNLPAPCGASIRLCTVFLAGPELLP